MTNATLATNEVSAHTPARLTLAGSALFLLLLGSLHVLRADVAPSWHFISEYALGQFGWLMALAFLSLGVAYLALFNALRPYMRTIAGRIGQAMLLISAAGLLLAIVPTDPMTTAPEAMTVTGMIHNIGGMLGMAMPIAAILVTWTLARNANWRDARAAVLWSAALAVTGFVVALISMIVMLSQSGGVFGPDVPVGWPNRFEIVTNVIWVAVVAWHARSRSA